MITRDPEAWTLDAVAAHAAAGLSATAPAGERVLLGVSGGSDSVGLAAALWPRMAGSLVLAHVDHGVRIGSADDRAFVESLGRSLDLPVVACRVDAGSATSETRLRDLRLAALERMARDEGCGTVVLAHHLDDALETALLHLQRGHRGARALAGPPTLRRLPGGARLCRPLLHGARPPGRLALRRARTAAGLDCVEDPSNADRGIPRNGVRALLADGAPPLDRNRLVRLRILARAALQTAVQQAAFRVGEGLSPSGRGSALSPGLVSALRGADGLAAECLRLIGRCLETPVTLDPRRSVLDRLAGEGRGRLRVPGHPRSVELTFRGGAGWLLDESMARGPAEARLLAALADTSLHL